MKSYVKNIKISPSKLRLVVDSIRRFKSLEKIFKLLFGINKKGSDIVKKAIDSAIANGEKNHSIYKNQMYLKEIFVGEGKITKFIDIKARGKMGRIHKRQSNLTVILGKEDENGPEN